MSMPGMYVISAQPARHGHGTLLSHTLTPTSLGCASLLQLPLHVSYRA